MPLTTELNPAAGRTWPSWTTRVAIASGRVRVESLDAELVVDEIYRKSSIP